MAVVTEAVFYGSGGHERTRIELARGDNVRDVIGFFNVYKLAGENAKLHDALISMQAGETFELVTRRVEG